MNEKIRFNTFAPNAAAPVHGSTREQLREVLDLQGLHDRCMGNLDLVQRVLDKFDQRLPDELAELERVLELADAAKVAQVAHRIKGNSSNVSASALQQAAGEIEEMGRAGRLDAVHAQIKTLHEQWQRYVDCRSQIRSSAAGIKRPVVSHGLSLT